MLIMFHLVNWSDGFRSCEATASRAHLGFLPPSKPQYIDLSKQTTSSIGWRPLLIPAQWKKIKILAEEQ